MADPPAVLAPHANPAFPCSVPDVARPSRRARWLMMSLSLPLTTAAWLLCVGPAIGSGAFLPATNGPLILMLLVSTCTDVSQKKIYNWATYPTFFFGIGLNLAATVAEAAAGVSFEPPADADWLSAPWWQRLGTEGALSSFFGAAVGFFSIYIVYELSGKKGAGDVKLATAMGSLTGFVTGISVILYTYAIAGMALSIWLLLRAGPLPILGYFFKSISHLLMPGFFSPAGKPEFLALIRRPVPMGAFFLLGTGTALYLKG